MEGNTQIQEAVNNIANGNAEQGFNVLYHLCSDKAVRQILSKTRIDDEGDAACIFNDAILKINEDIKSGDFKYISDEAYYSYLFLSLTRF